MRVTMTMRPGARMRTAAAASVPQSMRAARLRRYLGRYSRWKMAEHGPVRAIAEGGIDSTMVEAWLSMVECDALKEKIVRERGRASSAATLDLSRGEEECAKVMREAAFGGTGFFYLKGHGIPRETLDGVMRSHSWFFEQEAELKNTFRPTTKFHEPLGYKDAQVENILVEKESQTKPDFREHLRVARKRYQYDFHKETGVDTSVLDAHNISEMDGDHLHWVGQEDAGGRPRPRDDDDGALDDFKRRVEAYYSEAFKLSRKVHRITALSLGLDADAFDRYFQRPLDILMLNHYPAIKRDAAKGEVGMGAHCDFAFTTLLLTDGTEGLQVCKDKNRPVEEREWEWITPEEGTFVINFGDALERLTNGNYKSVLHRVANVSGRERKSVAFFCEPSADARIKPLAMSDGDDRGAGEGEGEEVETYARYLKRRFSGISEDLQ
ncbi:oxygenase-like protein [Chloropicon primus]|uniref:Oxygenase-like protein n=1 Tax=Chloropicon primus TaxID=1764295 RepID=A0A5B8MY78_9CHLO|nr:oxygenase-like protein [Chloropicon primus]|mmetsp:Transcript_14093/g.39880  ORF Transcript_14093/g.39880 Transcript_14093/m.39880 type:complete len:438 (+) Transcript_14093:46-1359(+)|eukprot:QDZ24575.1 oxygenase-like protein [Chloropicon primus]